MDIAPSQELHSWGSTRSRVKRGADGKRIMRKASLGFVRCCRLDRRCLSSRCRSLLSSLFLLILLPLPASAAQGQQANQTIKFKLRDGYLIVVQAMVNGAGPFSFLLDTGTTRTVIDPDLARQLQAPTVGEVVLTGILRERQDKLIQLQNVRLGEVSVSSFGAIVDTLPRQKMLAPGIRGVLGEDFLSKFNFLIDYKGRLLRFGDEPPAGSDADSRRSANMTARSRPTACWSKSSSWT